MGFFSNIFGKSQPPEELNTGYKIWRLEKAAKLEQNGKWHELLALGREWVEVEPRNFIAWQVIGDSLKELGKAVEAIPIYKKGLEVAPSQPTDFFGACISSSGLWYRLGNAYVKLGHPH
jgi:tetratricopeptide (TPR) repeat protein